MVPHIKTSFLAFMCVDKIAYEPGNTMSRSDDRKIWLHVVC